MILWKDKKRQSSSKTEQALLDFTSSVLQRIDNHRLFQGPGTSKSQRAGPCGVQDGLLQGRGFSTKPGRVDVLKEVSWVFKVVDDPMMTGLVGGFKYFWCSPVFGEYFQVD